MSKIVYFVVAVDLASREAWVDDESTAVRFPEGQVWDEVEEEWQDPDSAEFINEAIAIANKEELK